MAIPTFSFRSLFEAMNNCRSIAEIQISEEKGIEVLDNPNYSKETIRLFGLSKARNEKVKALRKKTFFLFKSIVQKEITDIQINSGIQPLLHEIEQTSHLNSPLTSLFVRNCYKQVIQASLTGIRKIAASAQENNRVIWSLKKQSFKIERGTLFKKSQATIRNENRTAWKRLKEQFYIEWGKKRVKNALFQTGFTKTKLALTTDKINNLVLSISEFHHQYLLISWERLKKVLKQEIPFTEVPLFEKRKLQNEFIAFEDKKLLARLKKRFRPFLDQSFRELPSKEQTLIQSIVFFNARELELAFQGKRLEGILDGGQTTLKNFFFRNIYSLSRERLQLYEILFTAKDSIPEEQLEIFYDEILVKALVKKIEEQHYIPTPWSTEEGKTIFYEIKKRILTNRSKLAYFLTSIEPLLKDLLVYRSTSSAPSTPDSLATLLSDLFPKGPGYFYHRAGEIEEREIFFYSKKILKLIGHSLGGCHVMLALLHRLLLNDLPLKNYELRTFDSPKIEKECCLSFAALLEKFPEFKELISINHYLSKGDFVPKSGVALLGEFVPEKHLKEFIVTKLKPSHPTNSALISKHPHNRHFYRFQLGKDFVEKEVPFKAEKRMRLHLIEIIRRIVGVILFPILFIIWRIKRFFSVYKPPIHLQTNRLPV
ncbi:hypothetical protein [Criblamydia sequanensis]|uniref:Conserved putative membrane protein n=1 Tax=Candidatus Criblamydia sequanensis CRIB-18 TaxID=1437425 RepID=A0A090CYT6_9BACT|nr:hypothetical protein [Criblamydia sequanensis]CDR33877.1 Conserved putative membrane protein [Criblamydia sequanensis CRIB-18]